MSVLITGAAGFIGSHLGERLIAAGSDVVGLDNFDPYYDRAIKLSNLEGLIRSPRFTLVEGDIRDARLLDRLAAEHSFDGVVHLAARAGVRPSLAEPALYADVNVNGTTCLLECARRHAIGKFVFASSSSVYGERGGEPFREDDNVDHPVSPYAATKKGGELLCYTFHHLYGMATSCMRLFTVYGPRQRPEMAIHLFTRAIERGEPIKVFGDGSARRDFTYVDDVVTGLIAALERAQGYRVYNLGNNRTVELMATIHLLEKALGKSARIDFQPLQPGDVPVTRADISRARAELDYDPQTSIEAGAEAFVRWYRTTRPLAERSSR